MKNKVKISVYTAILLMVISLILQYFLIKIMFSVEHDNIKVRGSLLLNDVLSLDLKRSGMERYDILEAKGISVSNERWGGRFDNKTVSVYITYPEIKTYKRECKTEEEWYEYTKDVYSNYHYTGINLSRLDSVYKVAIEKYSIKLPFVLVKIDSTNTVLEQVPAGVDYNNYNLLLDTIPLGIDDKDFLVARFDNSYYGMFRQMRLILITSFCIVAMLTFIAVYLLRTIFYQKKISKIREDFVNNIVHDLGNPVNYLNKIFPLIKVNESQQGYIDAAKRKGKRLSLMIQTLLTTSSITKALSIDPHSVPLCEYIGDIVDQYNADNEGLNILFICDIKGMIKIDRLHFENVVMNLIENAIKYSEEKPEICVVCYSEDGYICISVKDSGIGIPKEYMSRIFEKNFRVPESKSLRRYGFGLGLNYVKIVVEAHGGKVMVKSEYKKGSEFIIMIPEGK